MTTHADIKSGIGYRKADKPKPVFIPMCENCKHFRYDDHDYMNSRGNLCFARKNKRCSFNDIPVTSKSICNFYDSKYPHKLINKEE